MKYFLFNFFIFIAFLPFSQLTENFSDGNFTSNPVWSGSDTIFLVENNQLRSNRSGALVYALSTPSNLVSNVQWDFFVNLKFGTSGANYVDVFLMADNADLLTAQNGYFVRIGNTNDEVSLYSLVSGTSAMIIDGTNATVNSSTNNPFNIRVKRDASDLWTLETDDGATGNYVLEGSVTDNMVTTSSHFGFKITQSSAASPINNHFFDDISIAPIGVDIIPPSLTAINVISDTQIDAVFSENITQASAENLSNYDVIPFNSISSASLDGTNTNIVHLTLSSALSSGNQYTLTVFSITDLNNNTSANQSMNFTWVEVVNAIPGDLIINEFMCDPTPTIGLPEVEFVEIYNKSSKAFNLKKWKLGDATGDGTIGEQVINPGEYKVLCSTSNVSLFTNAIGVTSFPNLNNPGDDIVLKDSNGLIIDKITFDLSWYGDPLKEDGGYSIELKNPMSLCGNAENWSASISTDGGTPGLQNSIFDPTPDTQAPSLSSLEAIVPNFLAITFSEKMDSLSLINSLFSINPSLTVNSKFVTESYPQAILIQFNEDILASQVYTISLPNVSDCSMNSTTLTGEFSIPDQILKGDLVINEILFDPYTNGSDFIEIKNISEKIFDLKGLSIANFDSDTISNNKQVTITKIIKPGDFVVITADSNDQKTFYPMTVTGKFIQMSLPTLNNDSSTVYLINNSEVLDKVSYHDDWHFALLDNNDGKSLERIDPKGLSDDGSNWHTAASSVGFATPGFENSQLLSGEENGTVSLTNSIFSPDNDGFEDILQLNYTTVNPGMLASVFIYDDRGRLIHELVKNEYIGSKGSINWDGTTASKQKASIGAYVLLFEAFDLNGNKLVKKIAFVLAGKN